MAMITDDQYIDAVQKFFNKKLKNFQESGGWDVVIEKAQHCTYKVCCLNSSAYQSRRYLEVGTEDCENTAKLIESLMVTLKTVKREMHAEVERLEARHLELSNFTEMVEIIDGATKKTEMCADISESCTKSTNMDDELAKGVHQVIPHPSIHVVNLEAPVASGLKITASTSRNNQNNAFKQVRREPIRTLAEKLCRPPASLTGSFTVDQDEDTVTFLEPLHVLTFEDTTMDDTVRGKDNLDQITNSSKKENVGPMRISEAPVMKSELAKQWIREVARKMF